MFFYFFYFLLAPVFFVFIHIIKYFNKKISDHILEENESIQNTLKELACIDRSKRKILLFHAASAGEYEQLKPILKNIDKTKYYIIQSFTSPTIYHKKNNDDYFDVSCYHPYDIWWKSYSFFSKIQPNAYIITRHDIWPSHLYIASKLKIKIFYINANIHHQSIWLHPFIKLISKTVFNNIDLCCVPSKAIFTNLENKENEIKDMSSDITNQIEDLDNMIEEIELDLLKASNVDWEQQQKAEQLCL